MKNKQASILFIISTLLFVSNIIAQTTTMVAVGSNGKLVYTADAKGNTVPDFSAVGYKNSEASIPIIPVVLTVNAVAGDNVANVQNAINTVAAMPLQSNGFRGAILFNAGTFGMSTSINVTASGIVLRGVGAATNFKATGTVQYDLLNIKGANGNTDITSTQKQITNAYVPYGAKSVTVASGHTFQVGDSVHVRREPNAAWISILGMDTLTNIDPAAVNWTASSYKISYERKVISVVGNVLTFDAPLMDIIDPVYANGFVVKFTSARIQNCGVEYMTMTSTYTSSTDENHGWNAILINNIMNAWVKKVDATSFGYACVNVSDGASFVTVDSCTMYDPISIITGSRRYCFNVDGQRNLVQNCTTRQGRHDFVEGSRTPGPNVFYNCTSTQEYNDMGPHHRWSTGTLYDNIVGGSTSQLRVQNRLTLGSGHGWSGGQVMFWNCDVPDIVVQDIPTDETNWAIGCVGNVSNVGEVYTGPIGVVESTGKHIAAIPSLFKAQLNDRFTDLLPVKLLTFIGYLNSDKVALKWTTISEINTQSFDIEKSADGIHFSTIGQVKASGNSSTNVDYSFTDKTLNQTTNYYRLKQVDIDGKFTYSAIIQINGLIPQNAVLLVTPNPVSNNFALTYSTTNQALNSYLFNSNGLLVGEKKGSLLAIQQYFNNQLKHLNTGTYIIELVDNGIKHVDRFLKL